MALDAILDTTNNPKRILSIRIVISENNNIRSFIGSSPHERTLGRITITRRTEHENHTFGMLELAYRREYIAKRILCVRIIDEYFCIMAIRYLFEPSRQRSELLDDGLDFVNIDSL